LVPGRRVTGEQAAKCSGRWASRSASLPQARVGTAVPLTSIAGPSPHRSRSGADAARSCGTPRIVTSDICNGTWSGVNLIVSLVVRIGANRTIPRGPTSPPRAWPPEPAIRTCSRPSASGGRWIMILRTVRGFRQLMVRMGCASVLLAVQTVAGLPSKAARA
jgi:hypothetical protein